MSSSEEENEILDLRNIEDVFACLEAVAMAQAVLSGVDPATADQLEKVTAALGALSLLIDQGDLVQVAEKTVEVPGVGGHNSVAQPQSSTPSDSRKGGIDDVVEFADSNKKTGSHVSPSEKDDGIVDILTGEKIR